MSGKTIIKGKNTNYQIRLARKDELPALKAVEQAAAKQFAAFGLAKVVNTTLPIETLTRAQKRGYVWVIVTTNAEIVGFAVVSAAKERLHLEEIDIDPAHSLQGGKFNDPFPELPGFGAYQHDQGRSMNPFKDESLAAINGDGIFHFGRRGRQASDYPGIISFSFYPGLRAPIVKEFKDRVAWPGIYFSGSAFGNGFLPGDINHQFFLYLHGRLSI
jgi:hypothetical protein